MASVTEAKHTVLPPCHVQSTLAAQQRCVVEIHFAAVSLAGWCCCSCSSPCI
jgi:hypothetical protein